MQADWREEAGQLSKALLTSDLPCPDFLEADDKRFSVYRNNVAMALSNALAANFPALATLVGADFFRAMAVDFGRQYPPSGQLLFEYGANFPEFVAKADALAKFPYLADVARLESLWLQSYHETDALPLEGEKLQEAIALQSEDVRLISHPALRLLRSNYSVVTITRASRSKKTLEGINPALPEWCLVTRPDLNVIVQAISEPDFVFLEHLHCGATFGDAADNAFKSHSDFDLSKAIGLALNSGAFTAVSV
jgi:Putative DNA-binding domain